MRVPSGGPATINGILYQMLWTLLNAVELHVSECDADPQTLTATKAFLVVEPLGGGGDLVREDVSLRHIQQVKARSDGGTWSLTEIIRDVLPDLYKKVDTTRENDRYEFITEGRRGDWKKVEDFFTGLRHRTPFTLDAEEILPFNHGSQRSSTDSAQTIFRAATYTERALFDLIVTHLNQDRETEQQAQQKVWHLLSRFTCVWEQSSYIWQEKIDRFLLEVIDRVEDLQQTRRTLISALAEKATQGEATIHPAELFEECGLRATRLSEWQVITSRARSFLQRQTSIRSYQAETDVRPIHSFVSQHPIVVFSGDSGQGKSWQLFSLARFFAQTSAVAYLEATGNAEDDLRKAAQIFWQEIGNHDGELTLSRIAARLRGLTNVPTECCLYLFVDGLQNPEEAKRLATEDWKSYGIYLIASALPAEARVLSEYSRGRCEIIEVQDFSEDEMRQYLVGTDPARWRAIPKDVRDTLRRPLLARLYKEEIATDAAWTPMNEYALYNRWWQNLRSGREVTAQCLLPLSKAVLEGTTYPWTAGQLHFAGLDQNATDELLRHGGLQNAIDGDFIVWHDRLLNWLAAEALVEDYRARRLALPELCEKVRHLFLNAPSPNRSFGYVPLDVVWILATRHPGEQDALDALLDALSSDDWRLQKSLFSNLLPTVGPSVAGAIIRYLRRHAQDGTRSMVPEIVDGLAQFDAVLLTSDVQNLLHQTDRVAIQAATTLLARSPNAALLDDLWRLNCALSKEPERFAEEGTERDRTLWLRITCFRALKACLRLDPGWLDTAIPRADPEQEPVHDLAYLLAGLQRERERWLCWKPMFWEKVLPDKIRSLAANMYTHRDETEVAWLRMQVCAEDDNIAPTALRAITRIDPDKGVEALADLKGDDLYLTRAWCLRSLLLRYPERTCAELERRLEQEPGYVMMALQGQENYLSPYLVNWLLDRVELVLQRTETLTDVKRSLDILEDAGRVLEILGKVCCLSLLKLFEQRQGSPLEEHLTILLANSPRPHLYSDTAVREPAVAVLSKIGGHGITRVINTWLHGSEVYGRYDALGLAFKYPDTQTVVELDKVVRDWSSEDKQAHAYMAAEALITLEAWPSVIQAAVHLGMNGTPRSLIKASVHVCLTGAAVDPAVKALNEHEGKHSGAILALGIAGREDYRPHILAILAEQDSDSEVGRACAMALGMLDDPEGQSTAVLADLLYHGHSVLAATNGLLRSPNSVALNALMQYLDKNSEPELAAILLQFPETHDAVLVGQQRAIEIEAEAYHASHSDALMDDLLHRNPAHLVELFSSPSCRTNLEAWCDAPEGGIWHTGHKERCIKTLALLDADAAFEAASAALQDKDSHDREYYPYVLIEIKSEGAVPLLMNMMMYEPSLVLQASIARALAHVPDVTLPHLTAWLDQGNPEKRLAAYRIIAYQAPTAEMRELALQGLNDPLSDVMEAAENACWHLQRSAWCSELMDAFEVETNISRRWRLLDAALALGEPGDLHCTWPDWLAKRVEYLSTGWLNYIQDALKKRREEVLKELQEADRKRDD